MAAQSGLEIALYRLCPNGQWQGQQCAASTSLSFTDAGLTGCQAIVTCNKVSVSAAGATQTAYDFSSEGRCGGRNQQRPESGLCRQPHSGGASLRWSEPMIRRLPLFNAPCLVVGWFCLPMLHWTAQHLPWPHPESRLGRYALYAVRARVEGATAV